MRDLPIKIRKHEIVQDKAFIDFIQKQKELQDMIDNGWEAVQYAMEAGHVKSIKGDWGHITLATRKNYKAKTGAKIAPRFYKQVLDSKKVSAYKELHAGSLPTGVTVSETNYLTKKVY